MISTIAYIDGLVQDCSNSSALAMELLQACTKPSLYIYIHRYILINATQTLITAFVLRGKPVIGAWKEFFENMISTIAYIDGLVR